MDVLISVFDALVQWLGHGFSGFSGWEIVAYTLITTHITIAAVTIACHAVKPACRASTPKDMESTKPTTA